MDAQTKSIVRKLRRMLAKSPSTVADLFAIGKLASALIPAWAESEHELFEGFLRSIYLGPDPHASRCGPRSRSNLNVRVAKMALTYFEVPSLAIWQQLGYHQTAVCASHSQEECRNIMLSNGVSVLDLFTMQF